MVHYLTRAKEGTVSMSLADRCPGQLDRFTSMRVHFDRLGRVLIDWDT